MHEDDRYRLRFSASVPLTTILAASILTRNNLQTWTEIITSNSSDHAVGYWIATVRRQMQFVAVGGLRYTCLRVSASISQSSTSMHYLKHVADEGNHILIDDNCNITGITNWGWAQTMPKGEAFSAPMSHLLQREE